MTVKSVDLPNWTLSEKLDKLEQKMNDQGWQRARRDSDETITEVSPIDLPQWWNHHWGKSIGLHGDIN